MGMQERLKRALGGGKQVAGHLARPVNLNPPTVRDALGRVLELGDEVLVVQPSQQMRVAGVQRILHPGAPPNLVELTLVSRVLVAVQQDGAVEGLYQLRHAAAIPDGFLKNIGQEPAGEPAEGAASGEAPADPSAAIKPTTIHLTDPRD